MKSWLTEPTNTTNNKDRQETAYYCTCKQVCLETGADPACNPRGQLPPLNFIFLCNMPCQIVICPHLKNNIAPISTSLPPLKFFPGSRPCLENQSLSQPWSDITTRCKSSKLLPMHCAALLLVPDR